MIPFHHQVSSHLSSEGAEVDHFQLLFHNSAELIHEISVDRHGIGDVVIVFCLFGFSWFSSFLFCFCSPTIMYYLTNVSLFVQNVIDPF